MVQNESIELLLSKISIINYGDLKQEIIDSITKRKNLIITYFTFNIVNLLYKNENLRNNLDKFDIIHPDGIGIYLASKFIYKKNGLKIRFTGSDFYPILIEEGIKMKWSFFLFGDSKKTLLSAVKQNSTLNICGYQDGFSYSDSEVIKNINSSKPDILVVGLGSPKQEEWIVKNKGQINSKVIIAVGDGIKVFAGTKKRGAKFLRSLGLEWLVRLISSPKMYWKRYIVGIPLFIIRVIKFKLSDKIETNL